jgi:serine protease Do
MAGKSIIKSLRLVQILTFCSFLAFAPFSTARNFLFFPMGFGFFQKDQAQGAQQTLVRVSIVSKFRGPKDTVEINGKLLADYSPIIIQSFSATGIVLDQKGNILTFLGYRWLDIQDHESTIEVSREGQKWKAKLIGIDQRNGVAVVKLTGGKLPKTPTCDECEVKDGNTVMVPVSSELSQLHRAQIVSIGSGPAAPEPGGWIITVDRPFPDIGQPILTSDHRVLGFIASQDPLGIRNTVYPISLLLASAEKIIKSGGDIRAGWLGLFVVDSNPVIGPGVLVQRVEPASPAQQAGLEAGDFLLKYNGERIRNSSHYIQLIEGSSIGSRANLEIVRRGKPLTISASVEARKPMPNPGKYSFSLPGAFGLPVASILSEPAPRNQRLRIGVDTILLDAPLAESLQIPVQDGLLVLDVQRNSPADLAGVLIGDVILSIDGQPITGGLEFALYLQMHEWGDTALLQVNRKGVERTIPVPLSK